MLSICFYILLNLKVFSGRINYLFHEVARMNDCLNDQVMVDHSSAITVANKKGDLFWGAVIIYLKLIGVTKLLKLKFILLDNY